MENPQLKFCTSVFKVHVAKHSTTNVPHFVPAWVEEEEQNERSLFPSLPPSSGAPAVRLPSGEDEKEEEHLNCQQADEHINP